MYQHQVFIEILLACLHICPALPTFFVLLKDFVWIVSLSVHFLDCIHELLYSCYVQLRDYTWTFLI